MINNKTTNVEYNLDEQSDDLSQVIVNWHNQKYLDNNSYRTSGQPSLVYLAMIDFDNSNTEYFFNPI